MEKTENAEAQNELRVLVMAPFGRDASLIVDLLGRGGVKASVCKTADLLINALRQGAGAAILAEEALTSEIVGNLVELLQDQPSWADFPLVLLTTAGEVTHVSQTRRLRREPLQNVLLLERPVRPETLLSTVKNALRARARQYQIRDQIEKSRQAAEALRRAEKLAVAGRLAASIAHEINNPLESVTNLIYLLHSTPQTEQAKKYIQMAEQELARVSAIATQTLRFYRDTAKPARTNLNELLESVLALYSLRLAASEIKLIRELNKTVPVLAKAGELRQVFANLIGNAVDAMPSGGTLRIRVRHVGEGSPRPRTRVSIADTGSGIPVELRDKVFEPFVSTKGDTGTGLGLWVSKEIIENHFGSLRVRSSTDEECHGSVFSIYLPVFPPSSAKN